MTEAKHNGNSQQLADVVKRAAKDLDAAIATAHDEGLVVEIKVTETEHAKGVRQGVVLKVGVLEWL